MSTTSHESQTYQHMVQEIEGIINEISGENCDLDEMVHKVEKGYTLIKNLKQRLKQTKNKIEHLRLEFEQEDQNELKDPEDEK